MGNTSGSGTAGAPFEPAGHSKIIADRAEAIALSYFASLTNAEISQVMKKSEAAVKMLISRGLQDLRQRTSLALEVEE